VRYRIEWKTKLPTHNAQHPTFNYGTRDGCNLNLELADYFITSTIEDDSSFREVPIVTKVGALGVIGSHFFRAFAAPGTQFGGVIRRLDTSGRIVATIVVTGYYIPVP